MQWLASGELRLMRFNDWNFLTGNTIIQNWDSLAPAIVYEARVEITGASKAFYINDVHVGTDTDATHLSGTIGLANFTTGWSVNNLYFYTNNSLVPLPPSNLTLTILGANSIKLNFTNNAINADFIVIERKNGSTGTFLEIDRAPGGTQSYVDRNCQPNNDYYYRVRAGIL